MALAGCGAGRSPARLDDVAAPRPDALVPLGGGQWVAARVTAAGVSLALVSSRPERNEVVAAAVGREGTNSVQLLTYDGATGEEWNTFIYGTAREGVARVVLDSHRGRGGRVVDGAWVVALRQKDVTPGNLRWRFIGSDGQEILTGSGLLTAGGSDG